MTDNMTLDAVVDAIISDLKPSAAAASIRASHLYDHAATSATKLPLDAFRRNQRENILDGVVAILEQDVKIDRLALLSLSVKLMRAPNSSSVLVSGLDVQACPVLT